MKTDFSNAASSWPHLQAVCRPHQNAAVHDLQAAQTVRVAWQTQ